jgi:hypothetical protein
MASNFAQEWAAAEPDMDAELGEPFLYIPRAAPLFGDAPDVNARGISDPDRSPANFIGRYADAPRQTPPQGRNKPSSSAHRLSGDKPALTLSGVAASALLSTLGGAFQINDWISRDADGQTFRVEDIQPFDLGMVEFILTRIGSPSL